MQGSQDGEVLADKIRQQLMAEEERAVAQAAARKARKSRQKAKKQQQQQAATQQLAQLALSSQQAPATSSSEGTAGPLFQDSLQGNQALSACDGQAASQAEASVSGVGASEQVTSVPAVPGTPRSTDSSTRVKLQRSSARAAAASHASCLPPFAATAAWSMDVNKTGLISTVHATPVQHLLSCPISKVRDEQFCICTSMLDGKCRVHCAGFAALVCLA